MIRLPENSWQHTALAVGLLLVCLVLLYIVLVLPAVSARSDFHERVDDLRFQYTKFTDTANQMEYIRQELDQLINSEMDTAGFLEENARGLAAADLQKQIQALIESSQGLLLSIQAVQKDDDDIFPAVTIKVHMRVSLEALLEVLGRLESDPRVLTIDNLFLQSRSTARARNAQQRARIQQADLIETRLEITGYIYQAGTS